MPPLVDPTDSETDNQIDADDDEDRRRVRLQPPGDHVVGREEPEHRGGRPDRVGAPTIDQIAERVPTDGAHHKQRKVAHPAENLLQLVSEQVERVHVEQDVQDARV